MRVTSTLRCVPEGNLPCLNLSLPPVPECFTVLAPALADVSAFGPRLVFALTRRPLARVPAYLAVQP
jgi:hypothetical protein